MSGKEWLLSSYRVLDLTEDLGPLCAKILGDLGAEVIKVERPGGDPSRRRGPFTADQPHPEHSLSWAAHNANKQSITLDLETPPGQERLQHLARQSDFLIESFAPGYLGCLGLGYDTLTGINPRLIVTSITPFGQTGPYSHYRASDLELMATSGCMSLTGDPEGPPLRISLPQASAWAGVYAAAGSLLALHQRWHTGEGQQVDVSAQACLLSALAHAPLFWDLNHRSPVRAGVFMTGRSITGARVRVMWPCQDGFVNFIIYGGEAGRRTNQALVAWMHEQGMAPQFLLEKDWSQFDIATVPQEEIDRIEDAIGPFFLTLTKAAFLHGVIKRGMLGYPVATPQEILQDPQLIARDFWTPVTLPDVKRAVRFPGAFASFSGGHCGIYRPPPRIGEHNNQVIPGGVVPDTERIGSPRHDTSPRARRTTQRALDGIKVVEFAAYAAGPGITKYLADHGAVAVRVESGVRPDGFRSHYPPYPDNLPGLNRSGCFSLFNNDKLSLTLNLKATGALDLAHRLVQWADIVIENFTPGTVARLGLDYETLKSVNPQLIMLSTCNQGQTGPHAHHPGFGSQLSSFSGFTNFTGEPDGSPMFLYGPYIDFIAVAFGLVAILAALDARRHTNKGQYIDLSQYESGLQFLSPALLEASVNGRDLERQGNRDSQAAPHGVYPCHGQDHWCAISVWDDQEWNQLVKALGRPSWTAAPHWSTTKGRKIHEAELERHLGAWTSRRQAEEVMACLQAEGVHAAVVQTMEDLFTDPQLSHRLMWRALEHPEMGLHHYKAPPFILSKAVSGPWRPAPCLGEHTRQVLTEILGMTTDQVIALEARGALQ
jgi:crotonobetainyl-CoA:carnitine CoA-transferase CaiB-like acyl-CoA transferase